MMLSAANDAAGPSYGAKVRSLLESAFDLGEGGSLEGVSTVDGIWDYLQEFSSTARSFHPVSGDYLEDPLSFVVISGVEPFEASRTLPPAMTPELKSSFTFSAWVLPDASSLGGPWVSQLLIQKRVRSRPSLRTASCW